MHATLPLLEDTDFPALRRLPLRTLQVNLGYRCNQACLHCHVNAGPTRREQMQLETVEAVIDFLRAAKLSTLDITGGAPELNPHFRYLVGAARGMGIQVIDRCNLTILNEPGEETLAAFLAANGVEVVASMPCYLESNVDSQRGEGVYRSSIRALRHLNSLGYGQPDSQLVLNLMYNPLGAVLPPSQEQLEADYRRELAEREGVVFNRLLVLANMPIQRFGSTLVSRGQFAAYMQLLKDAFQPQNLDTVMCRSLLSVDWQGYLYDCDFNQMLDLPLAIPERPRPHLRDLHADALRGNPIVVCDHCYGCTAGQGSSCGGALE
ncbi:MAG: arsenosugar biosynthesis radical SAM protein ArsS [Thiogranum sp.]|jgi:radical SAM/Cys-rich protein